MSLGENLQYLRKKGWYHSGTARRAAECFQTVRIEMGIGFRLSGDG